MNNTGVGGPTLNPNSTLSKLPFVDRTSSQKHRQDTPNPSLPSDHHTINPSLPSDHHRIGKPVVVCTTSTQPPKIDFDEVRKTLSAIKGFLNSLNERDIGNGKMLYDKDDFCLKPRSNWTSNHTVQGFVNLGNPDANFDAVQGGFQELSIKCASVYRQLTQDSAEDNEQILHDLIEIDTIISRVASYGLKKLAKNYRDIGETAKASSLKKIGSDSFEKLKRTENDLLEKLKLHNPELLKTFQLLKYGYQAGPLLERRNDYESRLSMVQVNDGLQLPRDLCRDCIQGHDLSRSVTKAALDNAAREIKLPNEAKPVPANPGVDLWTPMRPFGSEEPISIEGGVWGTCEKDHVHNICNSYYQIIANSNRIFIGCGALDNSTKVAQLAHVMEVAYRRIQDGNMTSQLWVVHQFDSYSQKRQLVSDVHSHIYLGQFQFRKYFNEKKLAMLHFSTSYTATAFQDDPQALDPINLDSLAFLAYLIAEHLNKTRGTEEQIFYGQLTEKGGDLSNLILDLFGLKIDIYRSNNEGDDIDFKQSAYLKKDYLPQSLIIPEDSKEKHELLEKKQKEIKAKILEFKSILQQILSNTASGTAGTDNFKKQLILRVFEKILIKQLDPENSNITTNSEIELFILLYRLLNINPIFICSNGLDHSGPARALADAQAQLINELTQSSKRDSPGSDDEKIKLEVLNTIFELILNVDANRKILYSLTKESLNDPAVVGNLVLDLKHLPNLNPAHSTQNTPTQTLRTILFRKIDASYSPNGDLLATKPNKMLKHTQHYLELVASYLLKSECHKTLYSTGVVGLKLREKGMMSSSANPFPRRRMPMFCFVEDNVVQLLIYQEGWAYNTLTMTSAAKDLFERLSHLRDG